MSSSENVTTTTTTTTVVTLLDALTGILSRYPSGASRIYRLNAFAQFAATSHGAGGAADAESASTLLARDAYQAISDTCKQEGDFVQYKLIFGGAAGAAVTTKSAPEDVAAAAAGGADAMVLSSPSRQTDNTIPTGTAVEYDSSWVEDQESRARSTIQVLEHRLQVAQSQLQKESIRAAYLALASQCWKMGDWMPAFHALLRAKDYCTARPQTCHVCLQLVSIALATGNTLAAAEYIHKIQHTLRNSTGNNAAPNNTSEHDSILVQTALALERIATGDFDKALPALLNVVQHEEMEPAFDSEHSTQLPYWVSPQDVTLYAALLCLSHGTLPQMLALTNHVSALESVPALRTALEAFRHAKYTEAWHVVAVQLYVTLAVDPFLGPHLPTLLKGIRRKCWQYYWRPYSRVPLLTIAKDLGPSLVSSLDELRDEWILLILEYQKGTNTNMLDDIAMRHTRLNLATDTLHRDDHHAEQNKQDILLPQKLGQLTQQILDDSYAMIIRLACQEHDLIVLPPEAKDGDWLRSPQPQGRTRSGGGQPRRGGGDEGMGMMMMMDDEDDDTHSDAAMMALDHQLPPSAMNPEDIY